MLIFDHKNYAVSSTSKRASGATFADGDVRRDPGAEECLGNSWAVDRKLKVELVRLKVEGANFSASCVAVKRWL